MAFSEAVLSSTCLLTILRIFYGIGFTFDTTDILESSISLSFYPKLALFFMPDALGSVKPGKASKRSGLIGDRGDFICCYLLLGRINFIN